MTFPLNCDLECLSDENWRRIEILLTDCHSPQYEKSYYIDKPSNSPCTSCSSMIFPTAKTSISRIRFRLINPELSSGLNISVGHQSKFLANEFHCERNPCREMPDNPIELLKFLDEVQHYLLQTRNRRSTILVTCLYVIELLVQEKENLFV